jgi:hypothetical protein
VKRDTMRLVGLSALLLLSLAVATPIYLLETSVVAARECFASIEAPRGAALPDCRVRLGALESMSALPTMGSHCRRVAEEMRTRQAIMSYVDAAVGTPDSKALRERFGGLAAARDAVIAGTGRLSLDELGPPLPVATAAELAVGVGDATSLAAVGIQHSHHAATRRALEDALLDDDAAQLKRLVDAHPGRPNEDLRVVVAALSCATGSAERGMDEAIAVEKRRAGDRTANFSRHFGGARVTIEACAHVGHLQAPDVPSYGYAGEWDHRARMMALRMRLFLADFESCDLSDPEDCLASPIFRDNVEHVKELLGYRTARRYRLELTTSIARTLTTRAQAARLLEELAGEPRHAERMALSVADWLDPPPDEPFLPALEWERSAQHLSDLPSEEGEDRDFAVIEQAARAMWWRAAMVHALAGDAEAAARALQKSSGDDAERLRAGRALSALIAGDRDRAQKRASSGRPNALAVELAMPDRAQATTRMASARGLGEHGEWLALALGTRAAPPPEVPPRTSFLGPRDVPQAPEARQATLDEVLDRWSRWLSADASSQRSHRYDLWRHRGDAPDALVPWLAVVGRLVDEPARVEPWLDTACALDRGKLSLRRYAFARWRAAVWRADDAAAAMWRKRFRSLAERSVDLRFADLYREAGM